jgi:hypothetical protein
MRECLLENTQVPQVTMHQYATGLDGLKANLTGATFTGATHRLI